MTDASPAVVLAELELWHTRQRAPTRRLSLGNLIVPVDPPPGFGGILLGAVVARHIGDVDPDYTADLHRLVDQVAGGRRVVQPRLRHRFQVDRHGLARSCHRLVGNGEEIEFEFDTQGTPLAMVLGAIYAIERLDPEHRDGIAKSVRAGLRWRGPIGPSFIAHLAGSNAATISSLADPRAWALELLGFPLGTTTLTRKEVTARFRQQMHVVHPDHGGASDRAAKAVGDLAEARRILLAAIDLRK